MLNDLNILQSTLKVYNTW